MMKAIIFDFNGVIYTSDYDKHLLHFIKFLKNKYKIGMITNYNESGYKKYVEPIKEYFDDIVLSERVGLYKPDPNIYKLAANNLAVKPGESVYVDDHGLRVQGAINAGMHGIIYKNFGQMKTELEKLLTAVADN